MPQPLTVRIWRPFLLFLLGITTLIVIPALDIVFFKKVLDFEIGPDKAWIFFWFKFFMLGCGGLIWFQTLWYLIFPPTMMTVDEKGVSFGIGFRYTPFTIPGHLVEKASQELVNLQSLNLTNQLGAIGAIVIRFRPHSSIPHWQATSVGISYFQYVLGLAWYMQNQWATTVVTRVEEWQKSDAWKAPSGFVFEDKPASAPTPPASTVKKLPLP